MKVMELGGKLGTGFLRSSHKAADFKTVAVVADDGSVSIYRPLEDKPLKLSTGGPAAGILLSPSSKYLSTLHTNDLGQEFEIRLWRVEDGQRILTIPVSPSSTWVHLGFSADERFVSAIVSAGAASKLQVWGANDWKTVYENSNESIRLGVWHPTLARLLIVSANAIGGFGGTVGYWEPDSDELSWTNLDSVFTSCTPVFLATGNLIAAMSSDQKALDVCDAARGNIIVRIPIETDDLAIERLTPPRLVSSPDGWKLILDYQLKGIKGRFVTCMVIAREPYPTMEDLPRIADLLSGQRVEINRAVAIAEEDLQSIWTDLRGRYGWLVEPSKPQIWEFHARQARESMRAGLTRQAVAHFDEMQKFGTDPSGRIDYERGGALTSLNRHSEAEAAFRAAVQLQPNNVLWRLELGDAQYRQGKVREAAETYEKIIETDPKSRSAQQWSGHAHAILGDWETAADVSAKALRCEISRPT